jgi:HEAT repeat protein
VTFLRLFWILSWSFCALAVAILLGLVAYASWAQSRAAVRSRKRKQYIDLLKTGAGAPYDMARVPADDVLTDLAVELLGLIRGDEKAQVAKRASRAGVVARLHARLRRGNVRDRILAAIALSNFGGDDSRAALTEALDDRNRRVRRTAALALATAGMPPTREAIRRLHIGEHEASGLIVVMLVEMARSDVESVRSLLLDPDMSAALKGAAAEALAKCKDVSAVPLIARLAMDADAEAAELPRYLDALGALEHPAGSLAVLHRLDSPGAQVRAAAARTAGRIRIEPALDKVAGLLGDPDWDVRFQAAQALLRYGENGRQRLQLAASRIEEPARETAALTLAEHADAV